MPALLELVTHIQKELTGHKNDLYLVLSELYANALEHGLLGLNPAQKNTTEGFVAYYSELQIDWPPCDVSTTPFWHSKWPSMTKKETEEYGA